MKLLPSEKLRKERFPQLYKSHRAALEQKCGCKYFADADQAQEWIEEGLAVLLIDDRYKVPRETTHLVLMISPRTPRAATIEKAHIERGIFSDNGAWQLAMENDLENEVRRWSIARDIEMEERLKLFPVPANQELLAVKRVSDSLGFLEGRAGIEAAQVILERAEQIKRSAVRPDPFEGRPVLSVIGRDERTSIGKNAAKKKT